MYKLRKLDIDKDANSAVAKGYVSCLPYLTLVNYETGDIKNDVTLADVTEGWQVFLSDKSILQYHITSLISKVIERSENKVVFKTQTSLYELIKE